MAQPPVHFTIPGRPTAWQRTADVENKATGGRFKATPKKMKAAQASIRGWCSTVMVGRGPLVGPLRLEVLCVYAIPESWHPAKQEAARAGLVWKTSVPDWDNLAKQVGDALNRHAFADDAQIVRASVAKRYGFPERTEVRLTPLEAFSDGTPNGAFREWLKERAGQNTLALPGVETSNMLRGKKA